MQKMIWKNGKLIPDDSGKRFLVRALLASINGVSPEDFAEQEILSVEITIMKSC